MCIKCRLDIPCGGHELCHACAIRLRAEIRQGLRAIEQYLGAWSELDRWFASDS